MRVEWLVLAIALYAVAFGNGPWWSAVAAGREPGSLSTWLFFGGTAVALTALHFSLFAIFATRRTVKPLSTLIVVATSCAAYYMRTYAAMLDPGMVRNVVATDVHEASELLSWSMLGAVLVWAAAPLTLIWWTEIKSVPLLRGLGFRFASLLSAFVIALVALWPVSSDFTSLMRNQRELRYLVTPGNFLYSLVRNATNDARAVNVARTPVGTDAQRLATSPGSDKPRVFVFVLGETARAANFSLLGYDKPTNPRLAAMDIVAFRDVTACGTSTEVSVPCLFSPFGRTDYDEQRIRGSEGVLHVLRRAGIDVRWYDNQSGCKGVCEAPGVTYVKLDAGYAPERCEHDDCFDEILVDRLRADLGAIERDTVIVLHTLGNHGPAYYRRYPESFRRFMPDCQTAELRHCSREQIVNSFDNAILYTDHVLAEMIHALDAATDRLDVAMLYLSDHGESLGEAGLYLHGIPYPIAPRYQTHVPMIYWQSADFAAATGIDASCLRARSGAPYSHDNLFDSLIGVMDVTTLAYRPGRDLFRPCRSR